MKCHRSYNTVQSRSPRSGDSSEDSETIRPRSKPLGCANTFRNETPQRADCSERCKSEYKHGNGARHQRAAPSLSTRILRAVTDTQEAELFARRPSLRPHDLRIGHPAHRRKVVQKLPISDVAGQVLHAKPGADHPLVRARWLLRRGVAGTPRHNCSSTRQGYSSSSHQHDAGPVLSGNCSPLQSMQAVQS